MPFSSFPLIIMSTNMTTETELEERIQDDMQAPEEFKESRWRCRLFSLLPSR